MTTGDRGVPGEPSPDPTITRLVDEARNGSRAAEIELFELLYDELRRLARSIPYAGRPGETMQPTVLVGEAWLELKRKFPPPPREIPESRRTFFRSMALAMQRVVREHYRAGQAQKRGGGRVRVSMEGDWPAGGAGSGEPDPVEVAELVDQLRGVSERWHELVLHRYYAGRSLEETAELLGVSRATAARDWQLARGWLASRLADDRHEQA